MSKRNDVMNALFERLSALRDVKVLRNEVVPAAIPAGGLIILRDGDLGKPEYLLSEPLLIFSQRAEIEVLVQDVKSANRDDALDKILEQIDLIMTVDRTLSGEVDVVYADTPEFLEERADGGITIKAAVVPIVLEYTAKSNLS